MDPEGLWTRDKWKNMIWPERGVWGGGIGLAGIAEGGCGMHMRLGLLNVSHPDVPRLIRHAGLEYTPSYGVLQPACCLLRDEQG